MADKIDTKPKQEPRLSPTAFDLAEFRRNFYCGTVERGLKPEDVLNPAYWAYHAAKLKPWDRIELRAEDGTWFGEYLVLGCDRTWARVHPLRVVMLTPADIAETQATKANAPIPDADKGEQYEAKFRGPKKWSVIRKSDGAILVELLPQKADADAWLTNHLNGVTQPVTA